VAGKNAEIKDWLTLAKENIASKEDKIAPAWRNVG
jgi:hypothetical protein